MLLPVDSACGPKGFCQLQSGNVGEVQFLWYGHMVQWNISKKLFSFLHVLGSETACCEPYGILQESGLGRCVSMFDDQYTCAMGPSCSNPDPQTKKSVSVSRGELFMHSVGMCCCSLQGHYRARGSCDLKGVGLTWSIKIHVSNLIRTCSEIGNETTRTPMRSPFKKSVGYCILYRLLCSVSICHTCNIAWKFEGSFLTSAGYNNTRRLDGWNASASSNGGSFGFSKHWPTVQDAVVFTARLRWHMFGFYFTGGVHVMWMNLAIYIEYGIVTILVYSLFIFLMRNWVLAVLAYDHLRLFRCYMWYHERKKTFQKFYICSYAFLPSFPTCHRLVFPMSREKVAHGRFGRSMPQNAEGSAKLTKLQRFYAQLHLSFHAWNLIEWYRIEMVHYYKPLQN